MTTMPLTHTCWTRESPTFPGRSDYMEILPGVRRMIAAAVIEVDPVQYGRVAVFYRDVQEGVVQMRDSSRAEWKEHSYRLEGSLIVWDHGMGWVHPWRLIPSIELPPWFPSFQANAQAWLDGRGNPETV
jgi:hypothetical protein